MELAWCRKLELSASIVAYAMSDDELSRVALEVEGPGASLFPIRLSFITTAHQTPKLGGGFG